MVVAYANLLSLCILYSSSDFLLDNQRLRDCFCFLLKELVVNTVDNFRVE